jgi:antitoxin (DNA-binding transcriptional repressor) of toxin-antitoxin stability system
MGKSTHENHEKQRKGEPKMSRTLPFDTAKDHLRELVAGMVPGEELVLTSQGEPIAIVIRPPRTSWPCQPGSAKDTKYWMAPDFDAPLEDFKEYLE